MMTSHNSLLTNATQNKSNDRNAITDIYIPFRKTIKTKLKLVKHKNQPVFYELTTPKVFKPRDQQQKKSRNFDELF
jgi:hypothetical protein